MELALPLGRGRCLTSLRQRHVSGPDRVVLPPAHAAPAALQHISQPQKNHGDNPRRTRPHPIRAQVPHLKFGEITSLELVLRLPHGVESGAP